MAVQRYRQGVWVLLFAIACAQLSRIVAMSSTISARNETSGSDDLGRQRRLVSTEKFNWKDYLYYNKDLAATGITTEAAAVRHFVSSGHKEGRRYNKVMPGMENFDWRAYLQLNPDLYKAGLNTEMQAYAHYVAAGKREGRHSSTAMPLMTSLEAGIRKLNTYIRLKRDLEDIIIEKSNFVLYHLEDIESSSNSIAVTFNNVKLFASSIRQNNMDVFAAQNAFYWINVASINYNPLSELFPTNNPNVALVNWEIDGGEMNAHMDTLKRLSKVIMEEFSAVFFLNSGVRGPFEYRSGGEWMSPYRALLDEPNIGVVGAALACQPTPHIQTHFFVIKAALIPHAITSVNETYMNMDVWISLDEFMQMGITELARKNNYEVSSMLHLKRVGTPFFRGSCYNDTRLMDHSSHLASMHEWCHVYPKEVNFVRWSGEALGARGYACNKAIATDADSVTVMEEEMAKIAKADPSLGLELSEALIGGQLHDLYQSYTDEFWRHRNVTIMNRADLIAASESPDLPPTGPDAPSADLVNLKDSEKDDSKVCFLVRTTRAQDPTINNNSKSKYGMLQMDINQHIKSLLRQSNSNWKAFYVLTEKPVFSKMLRAILNSYNDPRLSYLPVDGRLLTKNEDSTVATLAVNFALKTLQRHSECRYISITSANHAYGSEVVERVLGARPVLGQATSKQPDILLAPMDSKYFASQDYALRKEVRWDQRCLGLEAMLRHNLLGFTIQPVPHPGKVFFASAFFSRQKMVNADYFGLNSNVTTQSSSVCTGTHDCQDGYFIQHLVRNRLWSYSRLALDGLKTIVFQENSPSLCVASGNVWFDYPHMSNVGCISHKTLYLLSQKDSPKSAFDWQSFHDGERVCLRLSNLGFTSRVNAARKAAVVASKPLKHKGGHHGGHRQLRALQAPPGAAADAVASSVAVAAAQVAAPVPVAEAVAGSTTPEPVPLPEDFNWKDYLAMNPDLQAEGIIFKAAAIEHYQLVGAREGRGYHEIATGTDSFDWRAYLELTNDVPLNRRTEIGATAHYKNIGKFENHLTSHAMPETSSWTQATAKLDTYVRKLNADKVELANRNLVMYVVEDLSSSENSIDIVLNNVRLFATSISQHGDKVKQRAFYLFNVISPHDNLLLAELPVGAPNVAVVKWDVTSSDLYTHIRTLTLLPPTVINEFSALFFTSSGVRGPLIYNKNGEWIKEFRNMLDVKDVGMVGPTMSCKGTPHVQTHFFALKSTLIPHILSEVQRYNALTTPWQSVLDYFTTEMSASVQRAGYQVTSRLTQIRLSPKSADLNCTAHNNEFSIPYSQSWDFRTWCDLQPQEIIFQRWGGEAVYYPDPNEDPTAVASAYPDRYVCAKEIDMNDHALMKMEDTMLDVASSAPQVTFVLPESPYGGLLYDLFKQYREEMWRERLNHMATTDYQSVARSRDPRGASPEEDSNVCFLIRTSTRDDPMRVVRAKPEMKDMDLASLIQSLLRQTNKNWQAYFFVTDLVPFENRLRRILSSYGDKRLIYFPLSYEHRPAFTKVDAGYTSTDYVMNKLKSQTECKFLSITNGDNVYGSEVVENVLHWRPSLDQPQPDILLAPLDSRNFAEHDYNKRHESELVDRCKGMHGMLNYNLLAYTVQPIPFLGRVDLAAVFLHRRKFAAENLLFGNFTNPKIYPCMGCQDGYLTQYLVRSRRWSYVRMPVDGLRSIIFHGPSPTWCVAAGNVWFDYPHVNKVGCFSHETVAYLRQNENAAAPMFDWENYAQVSKLCLRLSKSGFLNKAIGN